MESTVIRELMHPLSTNMRYSTLLSNVEELNKQYVHEPVIVSGMDDMQSQDNCRMADSSFNFLSTRA